MWTKIRNWFEVRIGLDEIVRTQLREYRVPKNINVFYTLGFVAVVAYMIQALTGFFLLVYYVPQSEHAFRSVQEIMTTVPYGWLFRQMHVVGSQLIARTSPAAWAAPAFLAWEALNLGLFSMATTRTCG